MIAERRSDSDPKKAAAFKGLNGIFQDCDVSFGGLKVGHPREDGSNVSWIDVFESYKEGLKESSGEYVTGISEKGLLMRLLHSFSHISDETRMRAINLFDELSLMKDQP